MLVVLRSIQFRISIAALATIMALVAMPSRGYCEEMISVSVSSEPPLPPAIQDELVDIFHDTLTDVLFYSGEGNELLSSDPVKVADAIRIGINIVIEPRGYTVAHLVLELEETPVAADFLVHPAYWTPEDPRAVTAVEVTLSDHGLAHYWVDRFAARIHANELVLIEAYGDHLLGLPSQALDQDWALGIVAPGLADTSPAHALFPSFDISHSIILGPTAQVVLELTPRGDLVELIRPRMYSRTLYNMILDRLRERLVAEADLLVGMPRSEVEQAANEIAQIIQSAIERDPLANQFNAYASVELAMLPDEPVALVDARVESRSFDLELETFVDFGNESRDSSEVQARFGVLFGRGAELFVNLNFFTNDSTLETDIGFGLLPTVDTFVAVGYDLERESPKYFFEQGISTGLQLRGEIFEDDSLNEFGLTYQFQQYLSGGFYTNGDNEYWARAIFTL